MSRPKAFLTYFLLCAIPLLLLAVLNYWNGIRTVDSTISSIVQHDLNSFNAKVDDTVRGRELRILELTFSPHVSSGSPVGETARLQPDLDKHFESLTIYGSGKTAEWSRNREMVWNSTASNPRPRPADLPQPDPQVWELQGNVLLDRPGRTASTHIYTAPILEGGRVYGALVAVLDLESVFAANAAGLEARNNPGTGYPSSVVVLDREGKVVYNVDRTINQRPAAEAVPGIETIATAMVASQSGLGEFRSPAGASYLVAYAPLPKLNVHVAVARSRSEHSSGAHVWGVAGLLVALLSALGGAFLLDRHVQRRSRGIERVREDLSAIAKGELDRRIILQSSDDARGLADNINVVTERLRAQIAREEESRQFESFVRLSAMLTHDLKNAIEGLSLTVGNMERHFDNPQFRTDALKGLTSATEKLKALVARLSRPLTSLSGEHKRPTNADLVPIIQRVLTMTAEPRRGKHSIVTRLPPSLYAFVDTVRIEEVIENLVLNALEAMADKGGTLTIEAGQTPYGAPTFSVSDTGRGMSRTFIDTRLFRPFSTTKKSGIGLGLYTCREVIKASAGTIEVESVEGAGTTFRVVLPSIPQDRRN